jgi:hypothetical protein
MEAMGVEVSLQVVREPSRNSEVRTDSDGMDDRNGGEKSHNNLGFRG